MAIKLNLSAQDILDMKFSVAPRGYDSLQVDEYLDKVLRDYRLIESNCLVEKKEIDKLTAQLKQVEEEKKALEIENAKYKKRFEDIKDNKNVTVENIDLIKRIGVLEKYIFKTGVNPKTIK